MRSAGRRRRECRAMQITSARRAASTEVSQPEHASRAGAVTFPLPLHCAGFVGVRAARRFTRRSGGRNARAVIARGAETSGTPPFRGAAPENISPKPRSAKAELWNLKASSPRDLKTVSRLSARAEDNAAPDSKKHAIRATHIF